MIINTFSKNLEIFHLFLVFRVNFDSDSNPNPNLFVSGSERSRIRIRIVMKNRIRILKKIVRIPNTAPTHPVGCDIQGKSGADPKFIIFESGSDLTG